MTDITALSSRTTAISLDRLARKSAQQVADAEPPRRHVIYSVRQFDTTGTKLSNALWDMQSSANDPSAASNSEGGIGTPEEEFSRLANMSLAERIRSQILEDKGLTEDDLAAMPQEQRKSIEAEIRDAILRMTGAGPEAGERSESEAAVQSEEV